MEQKSLTQTEIQQAKELQRLGLFQYINTFVWKHYAENKYEISLRYHRNDDWLKIGPLPTASECWLEMAKIVMPHKITSEGTAYIFELVAKRMHCGDLDQAFRQALIEVAKETK